MEACLPWGRETSAKGSCGEENGGLARSSSLSWCWDLTLEVKFISCVLNFIFCTIPWRRPSFAVLPSRPLFCSFTRLLTEPPALEPGPGCSPGSPHAFTMRVLGINTELPSGPGNDRWCERSVPLSKPRTLARGWRAVVLACASTVCRHLLYQHLLA